MRPLSTLVDVVAALDAGTTTAVALLEESARRLAEREPEIHALVTPTLDLAREQAARADIRRDRGDRGPLLGVPIVLKDLVDVAGVPTTAGSRVLADNVPATSAPVWTRLEAAGAVLVGKANTHEFAYGGTTEPTRNPSDPSRIVGGSSGGPAAALAAGYCWGAVGTDTAGSVRIPANLCGIAALKPTQGLVDVTGVIPLSQTLDVVGPMARTVADLEPLLRVMADLRAAPVTAPRRPRLGVLAPTGPTDAAVVRAHRHVVEAADDAGMAVQAVELPGFAESVADNFTVMGLEAGRIHDRWADRRDLYTPYVRERLAEAAKVTPERYDAALASGALLRERLDTLLTDLDGLLVPGVPFPAPPAYDERVLVDGVWEDRDSGLCRNTGFANLTGHPVLAVPAGLDDSGLPVGVQLVGHRGADLELIALGAVLEGLLPPGLPAHLR